MNRVTHFYEQRIGDAWSPVATSYRPDTISKNGNLFVKRPDGSVGARIRAQPVDVETFAQHYCLFSLNVLYGKDHTNQGEDHE